MQPRHEVLGCGKMPVLTTPIKLNYIRPATVWLVCSSELCGKSSRRRRQNRPVCFTVSWRRTAWSRFDEGATCRQVYSDHHKPSEVLERKHARYSQQPRRSISARPGGSRRNIPIFPGGSRQETTEMRGSIFQLNDATAVELDFRCFPDTWLWTGAWNDPL